MKKGLFQNLTNASLRYRKFTGFSILFLLNGCATSGIMTEAELESHFRAQQTRVESQLAEAYKTWPTLENATTDEEIIVDYYDEKGRKIGSAVAR